MNVVNNSFQKKKNFHSALDSNFEAPPCSDTTCRDQENGNRWSTHLSIFVPFWDELPTDSEYFGMEFWNLRKGIEGASIFLSWLARNRKLDNPRSVRFITFCGIFLK
jgi:hypothetical protein